ncbi:MAG: C4-type zinc ribbon domain-containing protein [Candidatus Aureabacteria bacterium]|nr:C4-type zinc ribbon domain-containing protein [Candidatus Auribacterota bacterium]
MHQIQQNIARLLVVQEKERQLLDLEESKERLPRLLEEIHGRIAEAEGDLHEIKASVKELQMKKKELEIDSESALEAVAKYEKQQFEIKSNVEYQALQKEINDRKIENSRIEDRIIEVMEKVDEKERLVRSSEEALTREREKLAAEEKIVSKEVAKLDARINDLKGERDKLLPDISQAILRKYQRIFANKRDTAIVPLVNYVCGGCHMRLPPQIANNVRKTDELVICENCSRILYWPEGLEKKEDAAEPVSSETAEK